VLVLFIIFLGAPLINASDQGSVKNEYVQLSKYSNNAQLAGDASPGSDLLTNRRKPLTANSSLAEVANGDVVQPAKTGNVVAVKASSSTECQPVIGLTYKDSTQCWQKAAQPPKGAPNVVFLVLDDIGYGGLGCFGGPVQTPNIDKLAAGGLRYTNFHTTAICSPTRACLLTGRNHHSAGVGTLMEFATGYPGYNAHLSKSTATAAEMLRDEGYNTYAVGKWHLVPSSDVNAVGPYDEWPTGRGFERYYGFLESHNSQWYPDLVYGNQRVEPPATPEEGYHLSKDLVNRSIEFINDADAVSRDKPFFLYLAFGCGHWPHHAPKEYIDKYSGKFDQGWDVMRNETLSRQKALGVVPQNTVLPPRDQYIKAWDRLTPDEKKVYARLAEVHAGYIDYTDEQIGRFIDYLEETGRLNNTMIVLISDNGASPEGDANGYTNMVLWANSLSEGGDSAGFLSDYLPVSNISSMLGKLGELGGPMSYPTYPMGWAMADNTPDRLYKWTTNEGGVHDPMIIYWPNGIKDKGGLRTQFSHAIDVLPTVLEIVGMNAPEVYNGIPQKPVEGVSLNYTFDHPDEPTHKIVQYFEMMGTRGLWYGNWKAVAFHHVNSGGNFDQDVWELYNLSDDASESHNLASMYPEKVQEMQERWWAEASKYNVLPLDDRIGSRYTASPVAGKFTYYPKDEKVMEPEIPDTHNSSYSITAEADVPESGAEGVLFSIGGRFAGLSLYVQDKHLVFDYNFVGLKHYTITSRDEMPTGPSTLSFAFNKTGAYRGLGTLYINGKEEGQTTLTHTVPVRYSYEEGMEIGKDPQTPVNESYKSPFRFTGTLKRVVMEVKP
ncbi:MAG TPA: sulfatase-like hydrolase/transferase, partial [Methanotrichaceae archaeon]|nr:sulfatase-like hydrolase/transferase [Methanotrichaceae archaeon]